MKTKLSLILLFSALSYLLTPCLAQVPQGFNYQAVAHSGSGGPLSNTTIQVKMGILSDTLTPVVVWEELHSSVKTNLNGVFNLVIGNGVRQTGSAAVFNEIDWSNSPLFLKIQINYQGSWRSLGIAKLWSVPYAMVAGDIGGPVSKFSVAGETSLSDEALFEVKNKDGQTVFAVYNEGVRIYVSDGAKAVKGGFAVGGFGSDKAGSAKYLFVGKDSVRIYLDTDPLTKGKKSGFAVGGYDITKGTIQNYLDVSADSVRIYIDKDPSAKGVKGGFAVGGYDMTKAPDEEYLRVTRDSTRVYVNDSPAKGLKGGFAVGGFDETKALTPNYLNMNRENYFIGHETGKSNTTGTHNMFFGYQAGIKNTTGYRNIFVGELSGRDNLYGYDNVFLGYNAGMSNIGTTYSDQGSNNVYIGVNSGKMATLGVGNTFVGANSGAAVTSGVRNTFLGDGAGASSLNVSDNTFLGNYAGNGNSTGNSNVCIGNSAGSGLSTGSYNTVIGKEAGQNILYAQHNVIIGLLAGRYIRDNQNTVIGNYAGYNLRYSTGNILLGYQAGYNETGNDKLYIENSSASAPLIGGDFAANRVGINRMPTTYTLEVGGTIWANGSTITGGSATWSDARYKTDIATIDNALSTIMKIRGVTYNWNRSAFPDMNFSAGEQMGVIAQEVEKILPQLVLTGPDGYKSVSYEKLTPVLIEALKEQQQQIETLNARIERLEKLIDK